MVINPAKPQKKIAQQMGYCDLAKLKRLFQIPQGYQKGVLSRKIHLLYGHSYFR